MARQQTPTRNRQPIATIMIRCCHRIDPTRHVAFQIIDGYFYAENVVYALEQVKHDPAYDQDLALLIDASDIRFESEFTDKIASFLQSVKASLTGHRGPCTVIVDGFVKSMIRAVESITLETGMHLQFVTKKADAYASLGLASKIPSLA